LLERPGSVTQYDLVSQILIGRGGPAEGFSQAIYFCVRAAVGEGLPPGYGVILAFFKQLVEEIVVGFFGEEGFGQFEERAGHCVGFRLVVFCGGWIILVELDLGRAEFAGFQVFADGCAFRERHVAGLERQEVLGGGTVFIFAKLGHF
jgi:hypothetical protein